MNRPEPLGRHCRKNEESIPRISGNIIRCIRDAEAPLILAPGDAKIEFKKRLESEALRRHLVGIETVDKMTDRQIAAKVRQYFSKQSPTTG